MVPVKAESCCFDLTVSNSTFTLPQCSKPEHRWMLRPTVLVCLLFPCVKLLVWWSHALKLSVWLTPTQLWQKSSVRSSFKLWTDHIMSHVPLLKVSANSWPSKGTVQSAEKCFTYEGEVKKLLLNLIQCHDIIPHSLWYKLIYLKSVISF